MAICTFLLNSRETSTLWCDFMSASAFSGRDADRNNPASCDKKDKGPIPLGNYYVVDRESGGILGFIDSFNRKTEWFALYADDGRIDDKTFYNSVRRGAFRMHFGRASAGCITFNFEKEFQMIRSYLKSQPEQHIPGTRTRFYGTVEVSDDPACYPSVLSDVS